MAHPTFYLPLYLYAYVQYYLSDTKDTSGTLENAANATLPNLQFHFFPSQKHDLPMTYHQNINGRSRIDPKVAITPKLAPPQT
jgi:hypothetical protein